MKILTDVVPRLEQVESWTEDELIAVLHEAARDLGIVQKSFMAVLRHTLSGMKVCGSVPRSDQTLIVLTDWTRGGGNHGCSWKRAERGSFTESRDRILNTM